MAERSRRHAAARGGAVGCLRDDHPAPAGERADPTHQAVLPIHLDALARCRAALVGAAARRVPLLLRPALTALPARPVGGGQRVLLRPAAVGRRLCDDGGGWGRDRVLVRRVHERHDLLYARPWGRGAAHHGREGAYRGGGGNGVRLSRGGAWGFFRGFSCGFSPRGRGLVSFRPPGVPPPPPRGFLVATGASP